MSKKFTIRGAQVVHAGAVEYADLAVVDGVIADIGPELPAGGEDIDGGGRYLLPGVLDCHVHFNDPGRAHWEGWLSGSAAAAAGGTTSVIDMPFNSLPPTVDRASFEAKIAAAQGRSYVDFALFGGLHGGNLQHLEELSDLGVAGFKAFMCDTGLEEFPGVTEDELFAGMEVCARIGRPVLVHAEHEPHEPAEPATGDTAEDVRRFLSARPVETETAAVSMAIQMAEATGARLHVVHVSTGESAALIADARTRGVDVTGETCPHYLTFTTEDVERLGAIAKCAPPIRDAANRESLWAALTDGVLTMVGSDHSPAGAAEKIDLPFAQAWGGIAGCQSLLATLLTEGVVQRRLPLTRVMDLVSSDPAERFGIPDKGGIRVGADADLILIDPRNRYTLTVDDLRYRHPFSPYVGRTFTGVVEATWRRGTPVVAGGRVRDSARDGRYLRTDPVGRTNSHGA